MGDNEEYDWDRAARLRVARAYMGLSRDEMADELHVQRRTYHRWESGVAAIPTAIWDDVEALLEKFDTLIDSIIDGPIRVEVPRDDEPMLRAVAIAVRERPELEPFYDTPTHSSRRVRL